MDGSGQLVNGSSFTWENNGGYFDSNPGTGAFDTGNGILVAQLTVAAGEDITFGGTASYNGDGCRRFDLRRILRDHRSCSWCVGSPRSRRPRPPSPRLNLEAISSCIGGVTAPNLNLEQPSLPGGLFY